MTYLRKKAKKPRRDSRADWKLLRPSHHGTSPVHPAPGTGGRKGWPDDLPSR